MGRPGREPFPHPGAGRRRRRDPARVPARRRPAPGALEVHRPVRRADGAPRGAAAAGPGDRPAGHPGDRPPGHRPRLLLRVGGELRRLRRRAPAGARLPDPAAHRHRPVGARARHRRQLRGRRLRPDPGRARGGRPVRRRRALPRRGAAARRRRGVAGRRPRRARRGADRPARPAAQPYRRGHRLPDRHRHLGGPADARPRHRRRRVPRPGPAAARGRLDGPAGRLRGLRPGPLAGRRRRQDDLPYREEAGA